MENLKVLEFADTIAIAVEEPKKIKTRPGDFKSMKEKGQQAIKTEDINQMEAESVIPEENEIETESVIQKEQEVEPIPVVEEPIVAPQVSEWKEPIAVEDSSINYQIEQNQKVEEPKEEPQYEWQNPVIKEEPIAPVYQEAEKPKTPYYSGVVPSIKSHDNIGDRAEKYKKLATTVNNNTYFGKVLLNGVDRIDKLELLAKDIEDKINTSKKILEQLDDKKALELTDKKVIEGVLEQTARINLNEIRAAVEKENISKVNSELSKIRKSLGSIDEVAKESDSKIAELDNEKQVEQKNISNYENQLLEVEKEKKNTCDQLEGDLTKADRVDKTIEAEAKAKEEAEKKLQDLSIEKQRMLADISFLTTEEEPKSVQEIKNNPFDSIREIEESLGKGRAA